jgi:hypothetical protein
LCFRDGLFAPIVVFFHSLFHITPRLHSIPRPHHRPPVAVTRPYP